MKEFIKVHNIYSDTKVEKITESLKVQLERKMCLECNSKKCIGTCVKLKRINCLYCKHFTGCEKACGGIDFCEDFEYVKR